MSAPGFPGDAADSVSVGCATPPPKLRSPRTWSPSSGAAAPASNGQPQAARPERTPRRSASSPHRRPKSQSPRHPGRRRLTAALWLGLAARHRSAAPAGLRRGQGAGPRPGRVRRVGALDGDGQGRRRRGRLRTAGVHRLVRAAPLARAARVAHGSRGGGRLLQKRRAHGARSCRAHRAVSPAPRDASPPVPRAGARELAWRRLHRSARYAAAPE